MRLLIFFTLLALVDSLKASSYSELLSANPAHPDQVISGIQKMTYQDVLKVLEDSYLKFTQTSNPIDESGIAVIHGLVQPKEALSLYLDCDMKQNGTREKYQAVVAIYHLLLNNPALLRDSILDQKTAFGVKSELASLTKQPAQNTAQAAQLKYDIGRYGAYILVLLNDDAGLDVLLTNSREVDNLSRRDQWSNENPNHFLDLSQKYSAQAKTKGINGANESLRAAYYQLCFLRKQKGLALSPQQPLVDLGSLEAEREQRVMQR